MASKAAIFWKYAPTFLLVLIAYDITMAFAGPGAMYSVAWAPIMPSGDEMAVTWGEMFIAFGAIALCIEMVKATRTHTGAIIDHVASMLVFVAFLVHLLVVVPAATGTFFVLTLLSLIDVIAGFTVTIVASRRDFAVDPRAQG